MKQKEINQNNLYTTIKIRTEDYRLVKENKEKTGVNIDFFVGQLIKTALGKKAKV